MKLILIVAVAASIAWGAVDASARPIVGSVTGNPVNGSVVTIIGSNFGVKNPAPPIKYDDFQGGTPGAVLSPGQPAWVLESSFSASLPRYSDGNAPTPLYDYSYAPRYPGDIAAVQSFGPRQGGYQSQCKIELRNLNIGKLNIIGWARHHRTPANATVGARNVKVFQNNTPDWGTVYTGFTAFPINGQDNGILITDGCNLQRTNWNAGIGPQSTWQRWEFFEDRGSTAEQRDERIWLIRDGVVASQLTNSWTLRQDDCYTTVAYMMSYCDQDNNNGAWLDWYWSDLYIDNTLARVEIGNAPIWENCTHREVQIPQTWTGGSNITAVFKQGSFSPQENVYLFVIDPNGEANNPGFSLVVGGEIQDPGPPGAPSAPVFE